MQQALFILLGLIVMNASAQKLNVVTANGIKITGIMIDSATRTKLTAQSHSVNDNNLRLKGTARAYQLTDGRLLVEFYDRQALLITTLPASNNKPTSVSLKTG